MAAISKHKTYLLSFGIGTMKRKFSALSSDDDAKYAQELQFEEAILASLIHSKNSNQNSASSENKEVGESSQSFCEICADRKDSSQMFSVDQSCKHEFCTECITKYIEVKLQKAPVGNQGNAHAIKCPGLDCNGILEIDSCREIMPNHVVSIWDVAICESMIDSSQKFYCPYKNCSGLIVNDSEEVIRESECPFCHRLFCAQCKVPWHSGIGCKEFSKLKKNERGREDLLVHELAKNKKWKRCPNCKFYVEKRSGCSFISCSADSQLASDAKYAEELQFQEAIMASVTTYSDQSPASPKNNKELGESSSPPICEICAEIKHNGQMFSVQSCSHRFCTECIAKHLEVKIQKGPIGNQRNAHVFNCPGLDCKGFIEIDSCREIIPEHVVSMWDDAICESMIDSSQKFYCPYKDCSALIVNDSEEVIRESECPFCHRLFCAQCKVPWHSDIGCNEFSGLNENERGREDLMVHELAKQKSWQRCPQCKFYVDKTQGCLHMTCRCGHQFCYACGATWSSTHGGCQRRLRTLVGRQVTSIDETYSYAEELQFQEALEASLNMSTTSEASSSYTSSLSSQICCEICTEDKEKQEMFEIEGCPHSFCLICISKHVESKLQDNIIFISCPGENCKNIIEPSLLKSIVPKNIIARWEEALSESTILDSQKYYCPFKDCSEILLNDNDEGIVITESECPRCRRLFCAQCNVPWHPGLDCKNFRKSNQDKREKETLRLLAKEKKWKECPNCKVFVDKTEGCIHITCRLYDLVFGIQAVLRFLNASGFRTGLDQEAPNLELVVISTQFK
ncbi:hypothetical protein ACJIZ3_005006 [Penstemon smallii]|uniref:RBR-type E3 ubiquitin transferase n=1 Tax=Penstemon smallii TaxID=265156 RepID=A0ABD3S3V1_9LAMI